MPGPTPGAGLLNTRRLGRTDPASRKHTLYSGTLRLSYRSRVSWDSYADDWDEDEGARAYSQAALECLTRLCDYRH